MSQQVFISYSRHDGHAHAERLETDLKAAGYRVWRDTRNINPNQDFTAEIEMGIEKSDLVAVCVTPDIRRQNSFVRREIQYADVVKKPTFPCRVLDVPPPISIINKEWLEFHKDWRAAFDRLLKLVGNPNLQQSSGDYQAPPDDPFRDYLQKLYQQIVRYLDQTVIRLIDLEAETSPDAVPQKQTEDILLEFFESSIFAEDATYDLPTHTTFKDAFEYHKGRLLLLGEPGAGKTITLMSHARDAVVARLEDPTLPLPILKLLATWKSNPPAPMVAWSAGKIEALKPVIAEGKALLLLDGLDELGGERPVDPQKPDGEKYDPRKRLIDAVSEFQADNQVLVTCRVADYAAIGQQIPLDGAITLQPLTDDQLGDYLNEHPDIYAAIQADEQLRDLARTPLLLSLITFAWDKLDEAVKSKGDLQAGDVRDAIFEAYCKQRYEHEAKKRHADLPFTYDEMMAVLGELAMWNAQDARPGKRWGDDDTKPEDNVLIPYDFDYVIKDEERVQAFQQMTTHLNILAPINETDYRFVHLLLRDFLAYTFALPRLRDTRLGVRSSAAEALGKIGDARAVEPLIVCLRDEDYYVRSSAAESLGDIGDARAVEPLIACLRDEDSDMRSDAAAALGKIGDVRAIEQLIPRLHDGNWRVRGRTAQILGEIGDALAVEPLIPCLRDEKWHVRGVTAQILGGIGDALAVDPLIPCLRDEEWRVRLHAAKALGEIGDARAVEPLIACLTDTNNDVRQSAARALGEIGDARAVESLFACLRDEDEDVRGGAGLALVKIGQPAIEPFIACLTDEDEEVRSSAVDALGMIGQPAVEPLLACIGDDYGRARSFAVIALGNIGDVRAVEPLITCLGDEAEDVRRYAAGALGGIGGARVVEPLITCLGDESKDVRLSAAEALGQIDWQPQTEDQEIQYLIASGKWGELIEKGEAAVDSLITCLHDKGAVVRGAAAKALGDIGDKRALESLIACLDDKSNKVRSFVAEALGKIADARSVQPLISLLDDKTILSMLQRDRVCDFAYNALQAIGTPEALQACADWVAAGNEPRSVN